MRRWIIALCLLAPVSWLLTPSPVRADYYTPDALLTELRADLEPWVAKKKGTVSIALDPYNFLELLAESPAGWRAVLHWEGEANPSDNAQAGCFCPQKISIGITKNLGLVAKKDEALVKSLLGNPAFLKLQADLRDRVRGYVWPEQTTERYMLYKGADPVSLPDGTPLAAMRLNFELTIGLPPVEYRNLI